MFGYYHYVQILLLVLVKGGMFIYGKIMIV